MKTMIVPVDFTPTSENALEFAAHWSVKYGYERIILLKSFYDSIFKNMAVAAEYPNFNQDLVNDEREEAIENLHDLCERVAGITSPNIRVVTATSELPLLRALLEIQNAENPELILIGSDTSDYSSDSIVAANVIAIAKTSAVRVLIVPANYHYQTVTDALVPFDFNTLMKLEKVNSLRTSTYWHDIKLHALNVDPSQRYAGNDTASKAREELLHEYLKNFPHDIHYRNDKSVIKGIDNFLDLHQVQLVIALPGKHSFLYSLTHQSISEALYRNAKQPVLILK